MWHSRPMLCFSLLLCGLLGECLGSALLVSEPKDKRGWTLNSAGYLLGPHAHQTLTDKGGLAGKREAMEDLYSLGQDPFATAVRPAEESTLQTLMDFLSFLHLRANIWFLRGRDSCTDPIRVASPEIPGTLQFARAGKLQDVPFPVGFPSFLVAAIKRASGCFTPATPTGGKIRSTVASLS